MLNKGTVIFSLMMAIGCSAFATLPDCLDNSGRVLAVNNDQIIKWKQTTKDQFHARGHAQGVVSKNYPDYTGHTHFEMRMGSGNGAGNTIEVIYNQSFGQLPDLTPGTQVEVCGDYITTGTQGHS